MQFQVPQFLDVEDKIIGPFTIKQFLYLAGGAGLAYIAWRFIPYLGLILAFAAIGLGVTLAFYKFNNKPFVYLIESAFTYIKSNRLYIWKRRAKKNGETHLDLTNFTPTVHTGKLPLTTSTSKLNDLTWSMDIQTKEIEVNNIHSDSGII